MQHRILNIWEYDEKNIAIMIAVVITSNIFPITGLFTFLLDEKHYRYSNANGSFTSYEFMGRRFDSILVCMLVVYLIMIN